MIYYKFGRFTLDEDSLYVDGTLCAIPPKELAVLFLLASRAGEIISKDEIITQVWHGGTVSDESLARCIYVIRKILEETSENIYISTVYGKGYRFSRKVETVEKKTNLQESECVSNKSKTLALFPFAMRDSENAAIIFDYILNQSDHFTKNGKISFLPSALTFVNSDIGSTFNQLKGFGVDFFLTGNEVVHGNISIVRIELIDSTEMTVADRGTLILSSDTTINLINASRLILQMIENIVSPNHTPMYNLETSSDTKKSNELLITANSINEIKKQLNTIDTLTQENVNYLAYRYSLLENFENLDNWNVKDRIKIFAKKFLEKNPTNALAIALKTLHRTDISDYDKEKNFEVAMMLSPGSADIYFYFACHLLKQCKFDKAMRTLEMATLLDPKAFIPRVLAIIILYKEGKYDKALYLSSQLVSDDPVCDIIIKCLRMKIYHGLGNISATNATLRMLDAHRSCDFVNKYYLNMSDKITKMISLTQIMSDKFYSNEKAYLNRRSGSIYSLS